MVWPVFPENGLANSVIPPVLAGLTFSTIFTETLGWNFSGLIVPGYLAPILVVRPFSGVIIIVEALITYVILRLLADGFSRLGIWTRFFGQDAFFALLCISILVKCTLEGPLQPFVGQLLSQIIPGGLDFRNELHSTGLIVVPLMANIFWRHGLRRNLIPTLFNILLTYLFLRFVLIPYTNFSVNKFELMYSRMAVNFEESARYYVILLIGAALANHNKYRYGWSYHGILIPALLGIAWLTPLKIITTFVEAFCILIIGVQLVKSRWMRNKTIEGPRKLLLLFSIGFALKMIAGFTLQQSMPGFSAMDVYGFAYILPALLAMEMWPGRKLIQVTRITLQTSFLAAIAGLGICIGLQAVSPHTFQSGDQRQDASVLAENAGCHTVTQELAVWLDARISDRIGWGIQHKPLSIKSLRILDTALLTPLLSQLASVQTFDAEAQESMSRALRRIGYELVRLNDPSDGAVYYILSEIPPINYRGTYVFRTGMSQPLTIQVPQPLSEIGTLPVALSLFHSQGARALLISGTSKRKDYVEFDVTHLANKKSLFQLVHQVLHREFVSSVPLLSIQVRGAASLAASEADVLLSVGHEIRDDDIIDTRVTRFHDSLNRMGLRARFYQGDQTDMHLSSHSNAQQAYVETFNMGEFLVAWFDRDFRECFINRSPDTALKAALGWKSRTEDLGMWFHQKLLVLNESEDPSLEDPSIQDLITLVSEELRQYSQTGNVFHLDRLTSIAAKSNYQIIDFFDTRSGQPILLLIANSPSTTPALAFNYNACSDRIVSIARGNLSSVRSSLNRFTFCHFKAIIPEGNIL